MVWFSAVVVQHPYFLYLMMKSSLNVLYASKSYFVTYLQNFGQCNFLLMHPESKIHESWKNHLPEKNFNFVTKTLKWYTSHQTVTLCFSWEFINYSSPSKFLFYDKYYTLCRNAIKIENQIRYLYYYVLRYNIIVTLSTRLELIIYFY